MTPPGIGAGEHSHEQTEPPAAGRCSDLGFSRYRVIARKQDEQPLMAVGPLPWTAAQISAQLRDLHLRMYSVIHKHRHRFQTLTACRSRLDKCRSSFNLRFMMACEL
jgi:hypothetical protein